MWTFMAICYEWEFYGLKNEWWNTVRFFPLNLTDFLVKNAYVPKINIPHVRDFSPVGYGRYAKMYAVC